MAIDLPSGVPAVCASWLIRLPRKNRTSIIELYLENGDRFTFAGLKIGSVGERQRDTQGDKISNHRPCSSSTQNLSKLMT